MTNLTPNEEYAFAVAAYNEEGHPIGPHKHGLGHSTKPILAYSSLCIYTGLCHLLQVIYFFKERKIKYKQFSTDYNKHQKVYNLVLRV